MGTVIEAPARRRSARARLAGVATLSAFSLVVLGGCAWVRVHQLQETRATVEHIEQADIAASRMQEALGSLTTVVEHLVLDGTMPPAGTRVASAPARDQLEQSQIGTPTEAGVIATYDRAALTLNRAVTALTQTAFALKAGQRPQFDAATVIQARTALNEMNTAIDRLRATVYQPERLIAEHALERDISQTMIAIPTLTGLILVALALLWLVNNRVLARDELLQAERDDHATGAQRRATLETQLTRSLDMTRDERDTWETVRFLLDHELPDMGYEVIAADSNRSPFARVVASRETLLAGGCRVGSPSQCPAAQRGQLTIFDDAGGLDACPQLRNRDLNGQSAACVPMAAAGRTVGVVHMVSASDAPPEETQIELLSLVARKAAERVHLQRAMADTRLQADTDPLTGLLNRRSLMERLRDLIDDAGFAVLFVDVDHFKRLNDAHGHEAGDQALRILAGVLRVAVRPKDLVGRFGGEEFVVVAPESDLTEGLHIAERLQESLALALHRGNGPGFTVSVGVAAGRGVDGFTATVARADAALLRAKAAGRNRVMADCDSLSGSLGDLAWLADPDLRVGELTRRIIDISTNAQTSPDDDLGEDVAMGRSTTPSWVKRPDTQ